MLRGQLDDPSRDALRRDLADRHCRLVVRGRDLFIEPLGGVVRVNDQRLADGSEETHDGAQDGRTPGTALKFDDVVACGAAKFLYKRE